jgi:prepilin-type N-terminal cleavage/methylation domain-containing protein
MRRGFSLLEMVAVLVLALILVGTGVMSWYVVQGGGADAMAGRTLRGVAGDQLLLELSRGRFTTDATVLTEILPGLNFVSTATSPGEVSVSVASGRLGLATMSESGNCLTLAVDGKDGDGAESRGKFLPGPASPCSGSEALSMDEGVVQW